MRERKWESEKEGVRESKRGKGEEEEKWARKRRTTESK